MTDRNLQLKYDILKARIANLVEEHADALALAQVFKKDFDESYEKWQDSEKKIKILEERLSNDIQKEKPRIIINGETMASSEDKS